MSAAATTGMGLAESMRRPLSLHTRMVLIVTAALLLIGWAGFALLEAGTTLAGLSFGERALAVWFQGITPRTRLILVSHITFTTGQIFPVKRICQLGRERGIEVVVDGAHAFAHVPYTVSDLDCDYYGTSLHKWLMAPHGTGFLYVRRSKINRLWPLMAADKSQDDNIRKFEEIGTHPAANHNAIAEALTFTEGIGIERKSARLRYLRNRWAARLQANPRVGLLTPLDPSQSCGIATFAIDGVDPGKLAGHLWNKYRIVVTPIDYANCKGIRVTPAVYSTLGEIDTFCQAVEDVIRKGLPVT